MSEGHFDAPADSGVDTAAGVPFESLFTLPFALHLRPVPHVSYLAEQDSGRSSDQDEDDKDDGSDVSSQNSNYRAGNHRLSPHVTNVPPHSLKTVSMLLERTGCLDGVAYWSELLEMLDAVDEDPHFSNLRAFFDARFDSNGRLIDKNSPQGSHLQRSTSRRASGKLRLEDLTRTSTNGLARLTRRQSSRVYDDEGSSNTPNANDGKRGMRAPEVFVRSNDGSEARRVRFKVRLDLHTVGLAPKPPRPPVMTRSSARSTIAKRLASSPGNRGTLEASADLQRVVSNSSSDHSHSGALSLRPVASPDSFAMSEGSEDLSAGRRGSDVLSTSPMSSARNRLKKGSRTSTMSSAAGAFSMTSELGTSPDSIEGGSKARSGLFVKNGDSIRRPSMIQRLMDIKGIRPGRRKDSASEASQDRGSFTGGDEKVAFQANGAVASQIGRRRAKSNAASSITSNEDALDVGEDEGSVISSTPNMSSKQGSAFSTSPKMGFRPASSMQPVQEGAVFSTASSDEGEHAEELSDEGTTDRFQRGSDFLTVLRKAANTSLTLRKVSHRSVQSPARTPKGSRSTTDSLATPPGSVDLEEEELFAAMLAPFKLGDSSWWLSGGVDPLPVSIACALSQALGWNGVMDLCYGKSSRSVRAGSFQPLGRAAEMDQKLQDERSRVQDWAQGVAGGTSSGVNGADSNAKRPTEEMEAREKLASLNMSADTASDGVGPSESASVGNQQNGKDAGRGSTNEVADNVAKISSWIRKKSGLEALAGSSAPHRDSAATTAGKDEAQSSGMFANPSPFGKQDDLRTWQDWAELTRSIADWLQEYETTRVRKGLSGEIGIDAESNSHAHKHDASTSAPLRVRYASHSSYQVPYCVVRDVLNRQNGFRRRHGIPEGLPVGPDGQEVGDYRWARKRLSSNHLATSTTLATGSLAFCMQQLATADWTHESAWELDYLEMCVFKSPVVSRRFPSPGKSIVPGSQTYQPAVDDEAARRRAMPCPYPTVEGAWSSTTWLQWLKQIQNGKIIVPAVSWQAWWTLIAVLNGGDGSDRALDVQLKAEEEPFSVLDDLEAVYI